jgi:hypothetical protein
MNMQGGTDGIHIHKGRLGSVYPSSGSMEMKQYDTVTVLGAYNVPDQSKPWSFIINVLLEAKSH